MVHPAETKDPFRGRVAELRAALFLGKRRLRQPNAESCRKEVLRQLSSHGSVASFSRGGKLDG